MKKILLALLLGTFGSNVGAFQEDVCPSGEAGWRACLFNPCEAEDESPICGTSSSLTALGSTFLVPISGEGARSTIHFDATYLLAQYVGFSPRDAFVVAAYNAATDTSRYVHRTQDGRLLVEPDDCSIESPLLACRFVTARIDGVVRTNFTEGGIFFHFTASPYLEQAGDGLAPSVDDPTREPFLHFTRRWAYGQGPLCVAGLVNLYGPGCFASEFRDNSTLAGRMPYEAAGGALTSLDWVSVIGEQRIATDPLSGATMPASELEKVLPVSDEPLARLGIYLHALADRVSHYKCVDASDLEGPRPGDANAILLNPLLDLLYQTALNLGSLPSYLQSIQITPPIHNPDYVARFDAIECDQSNHFLRHSWETGHDHTKLSAENQTARHGLLAVLDELSRFAEVYGLDSYRASTSAERNSIVESILFATDRPGPQERIDAITQLTLNLGLLPLPMYGGETLESWESKAGKSMFSEGGEAGAKGGGGIATNAILLLMVLAVSRSLARPGSRRRLIQCFRRPGDHKHLRPMI